MIEVDLQPHFLPSLLEEMGRMRAPCMRTTYPQGTLSVSFFRLRVRGRSKGLESIETSEWFQ